MQREVIAGWRLERDMSGLKALLFRRMLEQSTTVLKAYQGDLFHDAMFINTWVAPCYFEGDTLTFFYGFDESGTECRIQESELTREHRFRFTVHREPAPDLSGHAGSSWVLTIVGA